MRGLTIDARSVVSRNAVDRTRRGESREQCGDSLGVNFPQDVFEAWRHLPNRHLTEM